MKNVKKQKTLFLVFFVILFTRLAYAGIPEVSHLMVTDVTPVSFFVIWASSEPSTSSLNVFQDEAGTVSVENITIESQPVESGDVAIGEAAEDNGVMKVRVSGVAPDTTYYFQTITTSKSTSDVTYDPASPLMLPVTTESRVVRTKIAGEAELPFTNDLICLECYLADGVTPAEGTLLVAEVEGCDYSISGFVGDGIAVPQAYVDLNNLFGSQDNETRALYGGEGLTLTRFMGMEGLEVETYVVPTNNQLAEMKLPQGASSCDGDFDTDGDVDGSDLAELAANPGLLDLSDFAAEFGRTNCL